MLHLAHISDVHLYSPKARWTWRDWTSKRLTGWLNLKLRRGHAFAQAADVLARLMDDINAQQHDLLIFSGDATALAFEEEFSIAAKLFRVGQPGTIPGLAVPGNHDYYTRQSAAQGLFEKYFGPWIEGERVDESPYPFVRQIGPVCLIAVSSSTANRWPWDATGEVGAAQLDRLRRLLARPQTGPRILVTHYPVALASGAPERRLHRLRDADALLQVAAQGGVSLWLHGHRHRAYHLPASSLLPIPTIGAGSGTQLGCCGYNEYSIEGNHVQVQRRQCQPEGKRFEPAEEFEIQLA